jgi:hypothetical protein
VGTGAWLLSLPPGGRAEIAAAVGPGCHLRAVEKSSNGLQIAQPESLAGVDRPGGPGPYELLVLTATESAGAFITAGCRTELFVRAAAGTPSVREVGLAGMLDLPDRTTETLLMARTTQSWLLGGGWSAVDNSEAGPFRWIAGEAATLLLPVERPGSKLRVQALMVGEGELEFTVALDGIGLPARRMQAGWHWYEWALGRPLDAASHELSFSLTSPAGLASTGRVAIAQIEVLR